MSKPTPYTTESQIAAALARAEKATPGEWIATYYDSQAATTPHWGVDCHWPDVIGVAWALRGYGNPGEEEANARFIAASRQDIPSLVAAIHERDGIIADMVLDGGFERGRMEERREIVEMVTGFLTPLRETIEAGREAFPPGVPKAIGEIENHLVSTIKSRGPVADPLSTEAVRAENERLRQALREIAATSAGFRSYTDAERIALEALGEENPS